MKNIWKKSGDIFERITTLEKYLEESDNVPDPDETTGVNFAGIRQRTPGKCSG